MTDSRQPSFTVLQFDRLFSLILCFAVSVLCLGGASTARGTEYEFTWAHPRPQGNALGGADFEDALTGYAVGDRGALVRTTDGGSTWTALSLFPGFSADLEDLLVLGPGQLLAVGASPGIFRSTDGGLTWLPVPNPSTARLTDLERVAGPALSVVGDNGQVLRSTDDGQSWSLLASPGGNLREQYWSDATHGYVAGVSRARRTTDGGSSWAPLTGVTDSEPFSEVFFTDALHGYLFSDFHLWRTTNGGTSWTGSMTPGMFVYCGNTVVLGPQHFLNATNLEGAAIFESTNGGTSWDLSLDAGVGGFLDFDRLTDGTLLAIASEGDIFRSTDDGATWSNRVSAAPPRRQTIGALNARPGGRGAAGSYGTPGLQWYASTDGGSSWNSDPTGPAIAFTREIAYWDDDHAIIAGDYGRVWRSTDGGAAWTPVTLPTVPANGASWHASLPASGIGFVVVTGQSQALCYRTADFGATWQSRSGGLPSNMGLTGVSFVTPDAGFVSGYVGGAGRMYRTTDGGGQWTQMTTNGLPAAWVWDMHWHDTQTGLATVYNQPGGIFRTTNGGANWTNVWPGSAYDISFSDPLHGIAGVLPGFQSGTVFVTEDGGVSWQALALPATSIGGAVTAVADGFLVGGASGSMIRVRRIDPASLDEGNEGSPAQGLPANVLRATASVGPRLEVSFRLPHAATADLSVLNVEGRRVASILRGEFRAGESVSASWNGEREGEGPAPPGVYFIRLAFEGESRAVKVVLTR